ncbi:MAG: hypothetical protein PVF68_07885 [Acidobacteriota bacterium]|jgi:hypothetical protein
MGTRRTRVPLLLLVAMLVGGTPSIAGACGPGENLDGVRLRAGDAETPLRGYLCRGTGGGCLPFSTAAGGVPFLVEDRGGGFRVNGEALPCPAGDGPLLAYVLAGGNAEDDAAGYAILAGRPAADVTLRPLRLAPRLLAVGRRADGAWIVDVAPPVEDVHCLAAPGARCHLEGRLENRITGLWLRRPGGTTTPLPGCADGCRGVILPQDERVCWSGEFRLVREGEPRCTGGAVSGFPCVDAAGAEACAAVGGGCAATATPVGPAIPGGCASPPAGRAPFREGGPAGGRAPGGGAAATDLVVAGECPGTLAIEARGAAPSARLALILADDGRDLGATCTGAAVELPLGSGLISVRGADLLGGLRVERSAPAGWCGRALRILDLGSCRAGPASWVPGR